jgi:putative CocE/NonD family hydrolase
MSRWLYTGAATALAATALAATALAVPSAPAAPSRLCSEVLVRMSDGVRLHAWVSRLAPGRRRPVLFMMDSYSRSGQANGQTGPTKDSCPRALPDDYVPQWLSPRLIDRFTLVQVADRGTGISEGRFDLNGPSTQRDINQSIDWAARQPWSDGRVVLTGESGTGFFGYFGLRNPHVKAALIFTSCADMYRCFYRGGEYNSLAEVYLGVTLGDWMQLLRDRARLGTDGNPSPPAQEAAIGQLLAKTKSDAVDDSWWQQRSALLGLRAVHIPVMYTTDLYDIVQPYDAMQLTPGARLVLGMGHQSPERSQIAGSRYGQLLRTPVDRFLAHYGLRARNGAQRDPRVTLVTNTGSVSQFQAQRLLVRGEPSWPLPHTAWTPLFLGPGPSGSASSVNDGRLIAAPPRAASGADTAPLASGAHEDLRTSLFAGAAQTDLRHEETDGLTYTTPPFKHDLELSGPITLKLYASATAPNFDWSVRIADVWPNGSSEWITDGYLRADLRQVNGGMSLHDRRGQIVRPWLTYATPQPVRIGRPVEYLIDVIATSNVFRAGHRLRLDILPASDAEPDSGRTGGSGTVTVLRDRRHPSSVMLPVIPAECQRGKPMVASTPRVTCARSYGRAVGARVNHPGGATAAGSAHAGSRPPRAAANSRTPVAVRSAWRKYVEAPGSPVVRPVRVIRVSGSVSNPDALLSGHRGKTTLRYPSGASAPVVVLDYGREVGGFPRFGVASESGGPTLESSYSEVLKNLSSSGDGGPNCSLAGSGSTSRSDKFSLAAPGTVRGALQGGERYEMVTLTSHGSAVLSSAGIRFDPPLDRPATYQGHFVSSSRLLNRIWYAGAYTVNLDQVPPGTPGCTSGTKIDTPNIVDGAKRDRAVWVGDLAVADRTAIDAFGRMGIRYLKGSLTLLGGSPQTAPILLTPSKGDPQVPGPMPGFCPGSTGSPCGFYSATYSMDFVLDMYDYYLYTGDHAFVAKEWPLVQREVAWENSQVDPATGLFATTAADSADWAVNFTHPAGEYAAPTILHYESLLDAAALAQAMGDAAAARTYRRDAAAERGAVNTQLWDPSLHAYDASTAERGFLVQDANTWAALYGVAPPARSRQILSTLSRKLSISYGMLDHGAGAPADYASSLVSPYMSSFTMWADYQDGAPRLARALLDHEWGWMVTHDPGGTDWERIETGGKLASSDSAAHGWGTGATPALSQFVLGIQPLKPGFRKWAIQPVTARLSWAQGRIPSRYGPIDSRWVVGRNTGSFKLTISAPRSTSGHVSVPELGRPRTIYEDGRVVWHRGRPDGAKATEENGYVRFEDITGTHTFAWGR